MPWQPAVVTSRSKDSRSAAKRSGLASPRMSLPPSAIKTSQGAAELPSCRGPALSRAPAAALLSTAHALLAAKAAGHSHVLLDGTLIATDRIATPGPTRGVDLWWSGKHRHHGGNIQVVSAPDGWPLWTSPVRPGREHDTTAARTDPDLLTQITAWVDDGRLGLADLGYEGEADLLRIPIKKPAHGELTVDQQAYNAVHGALRCLGERANSLLKTTFKALRRWRGCPWRIGDIVAAGLVLLHHEHRRTT